MLGSGLPKSMRTNPGCRFGICTSAIQRTFSLPSQYVQYSIAISGTLDQARTVRVSGSSSPSCISISISVPGLSEVSSIDCSQRQTCRCNAESGVSCTFSVRMIPAKPRWLQHHENFGFSTRQGTDMAFNSLFLSELWKEELQLLLWPTAVS